MTIDEALNVLEPKLLFPPEFNEAISVVKDAMNQYRAIGTVEELKESKEQYDNINCAAKSIQLSGLCDFENAKRKIISEIKRNYEYSLRDYETIGTPEECREAVEKQMAKKPIEPDEEYGTFKCPNCGGLIFTEDRFETHKHCLLCGQKLDWRDEE